ncbi:hypothetical protein J6590_067342 [Homalodisca vitripennis]|nr:hypothetical protein J6590_067342 [Homalodisca vitripennis]
MANVRENPVSFTILPSSKITFKQRTINTLERLPATKMAVKGPIRAWPTRHNYLLATLGKLQGGDIYVSVESSGCTATGYALLSTNTCARPIRAQRELTKLARNSHIFRVEIDRHKTMDEIKPECFIHTSRGVSLGATGGVAATLHLSRDFQVGVPQGSVLEPVLFPASHNDMPGRIAEIGYTVMYADDTVLTFTDKTLEMLEEKTNLQFQRTKQYCSTNDLVFLYAPSSFYSTRPVITLFLCANVSILQLDGITQGQPLGHNFTSVFVVPSVVTALMQNFHVPWLLRRHDHMQSG